ncbi:MAG TPA: ABC transporter substrate-binding protein [Opitutaceae bacterium]|nr:ABC transporter substrate-binding protein [Opitutaceae bacterium]
MQTIPSWIRAFCFAFVASCGGAATICGAETVLRIGYFPNVTHAQGVIGAHGTRQGAGWFEERLGSDVKIQWFPFNAGPSAMEAIFAGSIDATYVGPNPALNAYIKSQGEEIRVLAGAALGGAALVVPADSTFAKPEDFRGKRIGTPQLGNTQDIAARAWLRSAGLKVTLTGGDVMVVPTPNPDQLGMFKTGQLDAVWTVEPWVSRLVLEANGRVLVEDSDTVTTILVGSVKLLRDRPELAQKLRAAHIALTEWIAAHPAEAQAQVRAGLTAETRREISATLITAAWARLHFTDKVEPAVLEKFMAEAQAAGLLKQTLPIGRMFEAK